MGDDGDRLVTFNDERALATARSMTDDAVLVCGVYTSTDYELLYVADAVREQYDDIGDVLDVADDLKHYGGIDFFERDAFVDMFPTMERTKAFVVHTDAAIVARVLGDGEALYVSFEPGTEITPVVDALSSVVGGGHGADEE